MTLASSLASAADLTARGIVVPASMDSAALLSSASDAIREAANCAITQQTSTVTLVADEVTWLDLPFGPVADVASVTLNGNPITGWRKVSDSLLMPFGWFSWPDTLPLEVVVTYTHGLPVVPADIVDLACSMVAIAAANSGGGGYGPSQRKVQESTGGITQSWSVSGLVNNLSPFVLPDALRDRLRERFGGSAQVVGIRR